MDADICGLPCNGRPCLKEPHGNRVDGCSPLLLPHELGFWPHTEDTGSTDDAANTDDTGITVNAGTPWPPWPRLTDPPIDQARAAAEELSSWRDHPRWTVHGLRLGIVNVIPGPDEHQATTHFAAELAWSLIVAAYESAIDTGDEPAGETGPVYTVTVLAGAPTAPITPSPASLGSPPSRWPPDIAVGRAGQGMTVHRAVAAAAHIVDLIHSPAARLLVLISDTRIGPEQLARVRQQAFALHDSGCGVLWLRTDTPLTDSSTDPGSAATASVPAARVLHLDPAAPVPGPVLGAAALDALHRAGSRSH